MVSGQGSTPRQERVARAADAVRQATNRDAVSGVVVLGSGFGALVPDGPRVSRRDLEGFSGCTVDGHAGELAVLDGGGGGILILAGRVHAYEAMHLDEVTFAVDVARALGAGRLLLTCAAGAVRRDVPDGALVLVEDHLNLAGWTPPITPHDFLDLGAVYDAAWRQELQGLARRHGVELAAGVLACVRGPAYETPAEVRMLRTLGADLVTMSTVPEAIRARALGMQVAALAVVANAAASGEGATLAHAGVLAQVRRTVNRDADFLNAAMVSTLRGEAGHVP